MHYFKKGLPESLSGWMCSLLKIWTSSYFDIKDWIHCFLVFTPELSCKFENKFLKIIKQFCTQFCTNFSEKYAP